MKNLKKVSGAPIYMSALVLSDARRVGLKKSRLYINFYLLDTMF